MSYQLSIARADDTEDIWRWRNQPHVRAAMTTSHEISLSEHQAWWAGLAIDPSRQLCLLHQDKDVVAVVNYFNLHPGESVWWGFYLTDKVLSAAEKLQVWLDTEAIALRHAFEVLKVGQVFCETMADNEQVLLLHQRFGFVDRELRECGEGRQLQVKCLERSEFVARFDAVVSTAAALASLPGEMKPPTLALLGNANWRAIASDLERRFAQIPGLSPRLVIPAQGQAALELRAATSAVRQSDPEFTVLCQQFEDFLPAHGVFQEAGSKQLQAAFQAYLEEIRLARQMLGGNLLVFDLQPIRPRAAYDASGEMLAQMNRQLAALCEELADCHLLAYGAMISRVGAERADPGKYGLLGGFPLGSGAVPACCDLIIGALAALSARGARALVLDLDNTLWGGIVGDDGVENLALGPDYPGNQFLAFQEFILALHRDGLPLAICSKNTEAIARQAMEELPDFRIAQSDIAALRINWRDKSENIKQIARELGLAVENLMVIDDNPLERLEILANCPGAMVPEMPVDVAEWPGFLARHPAMARLNRDGSAESRVNSYQIQGQLAATRAGGGDIKDYLRGLGLCLTLAPMEPANRYRALELFRKTNQFNTRTVRYGEADLDALTAAGGEVLMGRLRDKLGSDEIIAALTIRPRGGPEAAGIMEIENFVMSCRVLGRGVETAILAALADRLAARGLHRLTGEIIVSARNDPCRGIFLDNGFDEIAPQRYALDLKAGAVQCPEWIRLN